MPCLFITLNGPAQFVTVHSRHGNVRQHQHRKRFPNGRQRLFTALGQNRAESHPADDFLQQDPVELQIVHYENLRHILLPITHTHTSLRPRPPQFSRKPRRHTVQSRRPDSLVSIYDIH